VAVNPLQPYADITFDSPTGGPVGISGADPFTPRILSQAAWDMMNPDQQAGWLADFLTGADDEGGSDRDDSKSLNTFTENAQLDTSQVYSQSPPPKAPVGMGSQGQWVEQVQPPPSDLAGTAKPQEPLDPERQKQRERALFQEALPTIMTDLQDSVSRSLGWLDQAEFPDDKGEPPSLKEFYSRENLNPLKLLRSGGFDPNKSVEVPLQAGDRVADLPYVESTGMPTMDDFAGVGVPQAIDAGEPLVVTAPTEPKPDPGMDAAIRAIGMVSKPVLYGGATDNGADEAGLVRVVWGEDVPRMADMQLAYMGREASFKNARPGDLVGRIDDKGQRHLLGVYLKDGQFVATAGGQFAKRDKSEYADKLYSIRVGDKDKSQSGSNTQTRVSLDPREQPGTTGGQGSSAIVDREFEKRDEKKRQEKKKSENKKKSDKGGNRDKGSKYYGSEKKDSGNSSQKYSGIGATK
jgi:hypothetical protein